MGIKVKAKGDFELHPEGKFPFCVGQPAVRAMPKGERIVWPLESKEHKEDGTPFVLDYYTGFACGEKTNLQPLVLACGQDIPSPDEELDTDEMVGCVVMGIVAHKVTEQGGTFANIVSLSRPTKTKKGETYDPFVSE